MVPNTLAFWSYLIFLIPSIICSLFVLYHLLFDRVLRHALHNHVIIVVLFIVVIYEITVYPWMLYYYQYQNISGIPNIFCTIRTFLDWNLCITQTILISWAAIERHILIFHDKWVSTKKKRFFIHYLPLIVLVLYCFIFYIIVYFFPPCENLFDHSSLTCVYSCLYDIYAFAIWQTVAHQILPVLIIIVFSTALLLRVIWQKFRIHQSIQWRKYRKMTIQLLSVSLLYLIFYLPLSVAHTILLWNLMDDIYFEFQDYAIYFSYFVIPLFPFVCILSLPELRTKLIHTLHLQRRRIVPEIILIKAPVYKHMNI
ncbi:unnamed protein product [Adineta steineri]|uniref:G-protein coupled receptors family 1 profile domain-containing protein n=1 Tax=Adineta steineri TaxID=433720 RepID=A0A814RL02_9BILA|nr:unnamed protein product [Adineta steineri]CAF1184363.1 unnamed protein product [Adineta steineri]